MSAIISKVSPFSNCLHLLLHHPLFQQCLNCFHLDHHIHHHCKHHHPSWRPCQYESFSVGGFSYFGFPRQYLSQRCTLTKPCFQNQQLCSKYGEFRSTACHSIWLIFVSKRELCKTGKITICSSLKRIQRLRRKALLLSRLHHTAHTPDNNSAFCCSILAWPPL